MAYNLLPCDREQGYLMAPSLKEVVMGKKKRGRKPRMVEPVPAEEAKANIALQAA